MPDRYYALVLPSLLRTPIRDLPAGRRLELERIGAAMSPQRRHDAPDCCSTACFLTRPGTTTEATRRCNRFLRECGFDRQQHEAIRADLRSGRIGLVAKPIVAQHDDQRCAAADVIDVRGGIDAEVCRSGDDRRFDSGQVAVVTLAAGVGSRWTEGAGVCKALHPFNRFAGRHRSFLEVHLAKNRQTTSQHGGSIPHVFTTSYLTDAPIREHLDAHRQFRLRGHGASFRPGAASGCG